MEACRSRPALLRGLAAGYFRGKRPLRGVRASEARTSGEPRSVAFAWARLSGFEPGGGEGEQVLEGMGAG